MTQSMISDTIAPLDKAYQTLVKSSRSEADLLNYYRSLLKTTLYVPVVNVTGGADMQVIKKDLPLYAKTLQQTSANIENHSAPTIVLGFDTFERYKGSCDEIFQDELFNYIAMPAEEVIEAVKLHFGLYINFMHDNNSVELSKSELQWLSRYSAKKSEPSQQETFTGSIAQLEVLFNAISKRNPSKVAGLLEDFSDLNMMHPDDFGSTPLIVAAYSGFLPTVELLLSRGADINCCDDLGRSPLIHAVIEGCVDIVEHLIKRGANIHLADSWGYQAIHFAAKHAHFRIAGLLIEAGAAVNAAINDSWGNTPLHVAVMHGAIRVTELLLSSGAEISYQQNYGWSALHQAVFNGYPRIAYLLVDKGIDIHLVNDFSVTAFEQAERLLVEDPDNHKNERAEIAEFLFSLLAQNN